MRKYDVNNIIANAVRSPKIFFSALRSNLFIQNHAEIKDVVFLAGFGRSGTTWLSEIINIENQYRFMFEPFHSYTANIGECFYGNWYVRPDSNNNELLVNTQKILNGKIRNYSVDKFNRKKICTKILIKDVLSNMRLKWMSSHFHDMKIIMMLRHPCAVARSRMKLQGGWNWKPMPEELLAQKELYEDYLCSYEDIINTASTKYEKYIVTWCINNYVPLNQYHDDDILIVFYENLCANPIGEYKRICNYIGNEFNEEKLLEYLNKPSAMSRKSSPIRTGGDLISDWKKDIDPGQLKRAIEILTEFGLEKIYNDDPMPCTQTPCEAMKD